MIDRFVSLSRDYDDDDDDDRARRGVREPDRGCQRTNTRVSIGSLFIYTTRTKQTKHG